MVINAMNVSATGIRSLNMSRTISQIPRDTGGTLLLTRVDGDSISVALA